MCRAAGRTSPRHETWGSWQQRASFCRDHSRSTTHGRAKSPSCSCARACCPLHSVARPHARVSHAGTRHALCTHLRFCLHVCTFGDTPASSLHRTARAACRGPFLTAFPLSRCADECSMQLCVCRCPSLARPLRPSPRKIMIRCRPFQTRPQYACIRQPRQSWRRQRSGLLPRRCCPTLRQRTRTRRRPPRLPTQ